MIIQGVKFSLSLAGRREEHSATAAAAAATTTTTTGVGCLQRAQLLLFSSFLFEVLFALSWSRRFWGVHLAHLMQGGFTPYLTLP